MSQERRTKDSARRDLSFTSADSTLTDEALEKEEQIKKLKKDNKILKQAVKELRAENTSLKEMAGKKGPSSKSDYSPGPFVGAEAEKMIKEQAFKEATRIFEDSKRDLQKELDKALAMKTTLDSQLKLTASDNLSLSAENKRIQDELQDVLSQLRHYQEQVSKLNYDLKTSMTRLEEAKSELKASQSAQEVLEEEVRKAKSKLVEGEYSAYCYRIKEHLMSGQVQTVQLVIRQNCFGENVLEFENKNGDVRIIKVSLLSDVVSSEDDPHKFVMRFTPHGCFGAKTSTTFSCEHRGRLIRNINNFIQQQREKPILSPSPGMNFQRNITNDLRRFFCA